MESGPVIPSEEGGIKVESGPVIPQESSLLQVILVPREEESGPKTDQLGLTDSQNDQNDHPGPRYPPCLQAGIPALSQNDHLCHPNAISSGLFSPKVKNPGK